MVLCVPHFDTPGNYIVTLSLVNAHLTHLLEQGFFSFTLVKREMLSMLDTHIQPAQFSVCLGIINILIRMALIFISLIKTY